MDVSLVGQITAELMESLAEIDGEDASLRTVMVICEIDHEDSTDLYIACSDDRPWIQEAFAHEVREEILRRREEVRQPEDD